MNTVTTLLELLTALLLKSVLIVNVKRKGGRERPPLDPTLYYTPGGSMENPEC